MIRHLPGMKAPGLSNDPSSRGERGFALFYAFHCTINAEEFFRMAGNGENAMSINMKRITGRAILALLLAAAIGAALVLGADAASGARKRARLKNAPPPGWQFEVGYTLWRVERGLDATPQT